MRKKERETLIREKARALAATGDFSSWLIIEQHLRFNLGYPEARQVLEGYIRDELQETCDRAQARKKAPSDDSNFD